MRVSTFQKEFDCENVYCSLCDDFKSTMQATSYIIETGIEDILYLYNSKSFSALRKLSGYQSALTQKGLPSSTPQERMKRHL